MMTTPTRHTLPLLHSSDSHIARIRPLKWALGTLAQWQERGKQRAALARLDDRLLADVGVTREQVTRERAKPFWLG